MNILVVYLAALMLNPAVTLDAGSSVTEERVLLAMLLLQAPARPPPRVAPRPAVGCSGRGGG